MKLDPLIVDFVRDQAASESYRTYLQDLLIELVALDTVPSADLGATAERERRFFDRIEREIRETLGPEVTVERPGFPAQIDQDPDYTIPGYAADPSGAAPPAAEIYGRRCNLLAIVPGTSGEPGLIQHAHVDVVPPWFPPRMDTDRLYGRGACDNKAQVALLLAQMKLFREVEERFGIRPDRGIVYQFVIDEEIGGNGSLALALDPRFKGLPVLMGECTHLVPYCAHRGAVYYRCRLSVGPNESMNAAELFPFVVLALESESRRLARETEHPGFSPSHVQVNHGVLGHFGSHPGVVCDHVAVEVFGETNANPERVEMKLIQFLEAVIVEYVKKYGDKTKELDPATGEPRLARHFDVTRLPSPPNQHLRVDVWGISGHMAAAGECDSAITKTAMCFGALLKTISRYPGFPGWALLADRPEDANSQTLVLEGGQAFSPSHSLADVKARVTQTVRDAVYKHTRLMGRRYDDSMVEITFDRLHNEAYADPPDIAPMQALRAASEALGRDLPEPVAWESSCDARIYHRKGHPVAVYGAGKLNLAHSTQEHVDVSDVQHALAVNTLATWSLLAS